MSIDMIMDLDQKNKTDKQINVRYNLIDLRYSILIDNLIAI